MVASPAEFGVSERPIDQEVDKVAAGLDRQHHASLQTESQWSH